MNRSALAPSFQGLIDATQAALAARLDEDFLAEVRWEPTRLVLTPPPKHRLLGRPLCRAPGCSTTATRRNRICHSCSARLAAAGLGEDQLELLAVRAFPTRSPDACLVGGCRREWVSAVAGLCSIHQDQRQVMGLSVEQFCTGSRATRCLPILIA